MVEHKIRHDHLHGRHYAFCVPWSCGWTGPLRRWRYRADRDGRRHLQESR